MTTGDYDRDRAVLVAQLAARGALSTPVLEAMRQVPRHLFVPDDKRHAAYMDRAMSIGHGQTISQPYMVSSMTEHLLGGRPRLGKVLEVGCGSGYQAAILSCLSDQVVTIERVPSLVSRARRTLDAADCSNIEVIEGDGTMGAPELAPFDGILVAAGAPEIPEALKAQLSTEGGVLVVPAGTRDIQQIVVVERQGERFSQRFEERCVFVPLIGEQGWEG